MICQYCGFENLEHSSFCQSCGRQLVHHVTTHHAPHVHSGIEELSDVIFQPRKKKHTLLKIFLWGGGIGIAALLLLIIIGLLASSNNPSTENPYSVTSTPVPTISVDLTSFPTSYLSLEDVDSEWIGQTFYVRGILKNQNSAGAKNVKIRVDFSKDKANKQIFDTRYITVLGVSANGAYSFKEPIYINPPSFNFWYLLQIQGAEYLQ